MRVLKWFASLTEGNMSLKIALLTGAAVLALSASASAAGLRGTYVSFEAGANWIDGNRFFQDVIYTTSNFTYTEYREDFERGWAVMGSIGYAFDNHFRVELEAGYRNNGFDQLYGSSSSTLPSGGELNEFTLMANVLYDIPLSERVSLSVGAGAGADRAQFKVDYLNFKDEDWRFAYQGLLGLN